MSLQPDEIKAEIEQALKILTEQNGGDWAIKVRPILYSNLDRGRVHTFVENDISRVPEYVQRVVENYKSLSGVLHQLQIERVNSVWEPLLKQMEKWSYWFLLKKGYDESIATLENARECASEAAGKLLGAHFPYDTDVDPWARVIVQNTCMKFMRKSFRDVPVAEESYDSLESALNKLSASTALEGTHQNDLEGVLSDAVDQLPSPRREVIVMKYFEGQSPTEIATKLGKTVRAIHSLQFHAIRDLRKILAEKRDKLNE